MQNVKDRALVRMLGYLDQKQRKGFAEYLNCSLFNTNSSLETLYIYLEKRALNSKESFLSDEDLLAGSGINLKLVDKLCSQLLHHLNRFIVLWAQREDGRPGFALAFDAWYRMGLEPELLEREYRKMKRKLNKKPASEFDLFYELQLEHVYTQYQAGQPRKPRQEIFAPLQQQLDQFYHVTRLKYRCADFSAGKIFARDAEAMDIDISAQELAQLPAIGQAYQKANLLLREERPTTTQVESLFDFLEATGAAFSRMDRIDLYGYLLNSGIKNLSAGTPGFDKIVYQVYNAMLKHKLLPSKAHFSGGHFKNIVSIKVRVGKVEEARKFINDYKHYLPADEKDLLLHYVKGLVHFHSHDFAKAISHFRSIIEENPEDLFWGFEARNMLWKSYFEAYDELSIEEHEEMLQLYHSFRVFVSRNKKISVRHRTSYENFIRVFNRLIKIKDKQLWASPEALGKELLDLQKITLDADLIVHKKWILGAIDRQIAEMK